MNMSIAEYRNMKPSKPSKYRNKRVILTTDGTMFEVDELKQHNIKDVSGISFDSKMEANFYLYLLREGTGEGNIELQPIFRLQEKPLIKYIADFRVTWHDGTQTVYDVKGMRTQAFNLKLRLFKSNFPGVSLILVTSKGRGWAESRVS